MARDRTKPTAPMGLRALPIAPRQVDLRWLASSDPGRSASGIRGYRVFRFGKLLKETTGVNNTSFSDLTVLPDTNYRYAVAAVDRAGNRSALSEDVLVRTPPMTSGELLPDTTPPTVPGNIRVTQ
jgi:chitin-binding protein